MKLSQILCYISSSGIWILGTQHICLCLHILTQDFYYFRCHLNTGPVPSATSPQHPAQSSYTPSTHTKSAPSKYETDSSYWCNEFTLQGVPERGCCTIWQPDLQTNLNTELIVYPDRPLCTWSNCLCRASICFVSEAVEATAVGEDVSELLLFFEVWGCFCFRSW